MTSSWFWSSSRSIAGPGVLAPVLALALAAIPAAPAPAAEVISRDVRLTIGADGGVTERLALRVRLDEAGDLDLWSPYPIVLDANRTLVAASGWALRPDGSRVILGEDDVETVEGAAGGGVLHSSTGLRLLRFPPLPAGSELAIAYEVREEPWFESGSIRLTDGAPVDRLSVAIELPPDGEAGDGFRWRLDGPRAGPDADAGLEVEETASGLTVSGRDLEELATGERETVLRYAWGPVRTWTDVGRWYEGLIRDVPRGDEEIRALAREAVAGVDDPRERTAILLELVRERVRYVAVEVGVGGYRPSPPGEVLERRWGDCKDKSLLLIDLLAQAGVEAHPALVRLDEHRRIDSRFPGADQFNHLIVAAPEEALPVGPGDVAGGGYLFLDPTQDRGGLTWVHPALQGQHALVVRGDSSGLAEIPALPDREIRELEVRLTVGEDGDAAGAASLRLSGYGGWRLIGGTASEAQERLAELATVLLGNVVGGTVLGTPRWRQGDVDGVPRVELSAPVRLDRLIAGRSVRSFSLPGPAAFSEASELRGVADVVPARPVRWTTTWELSLPAGWCAPEPAEVEVTNSVGSFRQRVIAAGEGRVRIERRAELAVRWIEPEAVADALELTLAEHRAIRRRIRLECPPSGGEPGAGPGTT
jgi:hypothetical protein